jgi:hypothetical protein
LQLRNDGLLRTRNRDGGIRILKNVVLGTIEEIVEVSVERWSVGALVHLRATVRT